MSSYETPNAETIAALDDADCNTYHSVGEQLAPLSRFEPVIETDLTDEEREIIRQGEIDYKTDPDSFITLSEYRALRSSQNPPDPTN
jgi:hypothetical protein